MVLFADEFDVFDGGISSKCVLDFVAIGTTDPDVGHDVIRIGAIALSMTGLSPDVASFQAASAF